MPTIISALIGNIDAEPWEALEEESDSRQNLSKN